MEHHSAQAVIAILEKVLTETDAKTITLSRLQVDLLTADERFAATPTLERISGIAGYWNGLIILLNTHKESSSG